jgi:hypothetical protein
MDRNCFNKDRSKKLLITAFTAKPRSRTSHHSLTFKVSWHNSSITALSVNPRNVYTVQYFAGKMPDCHVFMAQKICSCKGWLTQDFRIQVFFTHQFSPGPWVSSWGYFELLRKFAEIFATKCLSPVSTTPAISCSPVSTIPAIYHHRGRCYRR